MCIIFISARSLAECPIPTDKGTEREGTELALGHTTSRWQSRGWTQGLPISTAPAPFLRSYCNARVIHPANFFCGMQLGIATVGLKAVMGKRGEIICNIGGKLCLMGVA